ncbi:MAG: LysR family transcriptional regulator, partial [Castellaniella sp.]|uniref:LysR family transcriptional regulator n=1 Tax=Castellaniella sp. TaxID=1955812 RepID=UPI001224D654
MLVVLAGYYRKRRSALEIRQLRYFVGAVENGSLGRAARELNLTTATLSQQISRLESELFVRLLQRTSTGVVPTAAGLAFFRRSQLALRNIDEAVRSAQKARLSGFVSIGLAPTTASVIGLPLIMAMRERYPDVRVRLVELLSGNLTAMLNTRQLDLAILFNDDVADKWAIIPLLKESLYIMAAPGFKGFPKSEKVRLADVGNLPLAMPSRLHGLRNVLTSAAGREPLSLNVAIELDSLPVLMGVVSMGLMATIQPAAALRHAKGENLMVSEISDSWFVRHNLLVSLSDEELSP